MKITISQSVSLLHALLYILASASISLANPNGWTNLSIDTSFSCNDLVQISLDENCEIFISPDMILEGYDGDLNDFDVEVLDPTGLSVPMPVNGDFIGDSIFIIVTHVPSELSCWGKALIEDKWAPLLNCNDFQINCFDDPGIFPLPDIWDNCDSHPELILLSEEIDNSNLCQQANITQTFQAIDESGNESNICTQKIVATPPTLPIFPKDTIWDCQVYNSFPNIINPTPVTDSLHTTGSGNPNVDNGMFCPFNVVYSDFIFENDCGETFTIVRTWTVINWCTDEIITIGDEGGDNVQLIKISDQTPPVIERSNFTVNANIGSAINEECGSTDLLLPPSLIDDCHTVTIRILTGIGEAIYINDDGKNGGFIPSPGLPIGEHNIVYEAIDECGNTDSLHVKVMVVDQTAPIPVCDKLTNVSLGIEGETFVPASALDDGSYDNCCFDKVLVKKMNVTCIDTDTLFQDSLELCCADVGDTVQVILRAFDCSGNTNECMVLIEVEEKLPPTLESCPPSQTIDCQFYTNFLELPLSEGNDSVLLQFGTPEFYDNCEIIFLESSVQINLDQCLEGNIRRVWRVTDSGENLEISCVQSIDVLHHSDWLVEFPEDQNIDCGEELPPTGEPVIFYENCELIAVNYEDEIFTVVPDACFKISRTWTVINWCLINGDIENTIIESSEQALNFDLNYDSQLSPRIFKDGLNSANFSQQSSQIGAQPDGVVVYQQEISVVDETSPTVICEPYIEICIEDTTCSADLLLPYPEIIDCGLSLTVSATGDLGIGLGPFIDVPLGVYEMMYQVDDNCGNQGYCATLLEVKDCKKPTPFCKNGLIIEMEADSIVIVNAEIFNDGSFDNCPGELIYSFSSNPEDSLRIFDCSSLGYFEIEVWLTDATGNQDLCKTFITIQDNDGVCAGLPLISGTINTNENKPISQVNIQINSGSSETLSDSSGYYVLEAETGEDISLVPTKNDYPLNGVTTYDIVLISKHILGIELLDTPYDIIAADANFSNTITTFDLVAIRKLILQINTTFPNGNSWRFIDRKYIFPNPLNPFETSFPEVLNMNNVVEDIKDADLVGIKIGDVNNSVATN